MGKLLSPVKRRRAADEIREELDVSERRVCRVLEQPRSTQRQQRAVNTDEEVLKERMVALACGYGRYGVIVGPQHCSEVKDGMSTINALSGSGIR
jgi:putative transposase